MTLKASPERDIDNTGSSPAGPQRRHTGRRRILLAAMMLTMPLIAQSPSSPDGPYAASPLAGSIEGRMEAKRIAMLNVIRQKAMVTEADKLLHLARQLSDDAAAGGTKMSDAERMHKAAEIEKLAKNVKEKMTYAIGAPEGLSGPFNAWQH